jgi:uncharacterized protein YoxC
MRNLTYFLPAFIILTVFISVNIASVSSTAEQMSMNTESVTQSVEELDAAIKGIDH